jgi:AraC-like DNA-binding protein
MSKRLTDPSTPTTGDLDLLADLIGGSAVGTLSARAWYAGRWSLAFASSEEVGFHIVGEGEVDLRLEDGTVERLRRGDVALVSAAHILATDLRRRPVPFTLERGAAMSVDEEDGDVCLLCGAYRVDRTARHPVFDSLPPAIVLRSGQRHPSVDAMVAVLDSEFQRQAPGARAVATRLIDAMLVYILRHWIESDCPRASRWLKALRDPVLARALALIHNEYSTAWSLDTLARAAGTSRASLARNFTAEVGTPPMQFLTERRLFVARGLLESSSMSLEEVARAVGYATAFSLSKAFKRHYGESPRHLQRSA